MGVVVRFSQRRRVHLSDTEEADSSISPNAQIERGLKLVSWSLLIYLSVILLGVAMTVTMMIWYPSASSSYLTYMSVFALPAGLLSISYTAIFLIGFSALYRSRGRVGNDYERNMKKSLYLLIGSVTILIASPVASFLTPRLLFSTLGSEVYLEAWATISLALGGVQVLAAFLLALLFYFLVVSLAQSTHQTRLKVAATLYVAAAGIDFAWAAISNLIGESSFQFDLYSYYAQVFVRFPAILLFWSVYRASHRSLEWAS